MKNQKSDPIFLQIFCPNSRCSKKNRQVIRKGFAFRKNGSPRRNYKCKGCNKKFSDSTFDHLFRCKRRDPFENQKIFFGIVHARSNRSLARELKSSENFIRQRAMKLTQASILAHNEILKNLKIKEDIAYDGLEAFAHSQYEPNNINQCVGSRSLFTYTFNFAPMNRKGYISPRQKNYLEKLELKKGRFDPKAIRKASKIIFEDLVKRKDPGIPKITLYSDEHFQYRRALNLDMNPQLRSQIDHQTVSSKETRNYKNILFPVNHLDLLIRQKVTAFTRETISFAKKHSRMISKYILFICYKNYMRPQFVKKHKTDSRAHLDSPAMKLKIKSELLSLAKFLGPRNPCPAIESLPLDWPLIYQDRVGFSRSLAFKKFSKIAL